LFISSQGFPEGCGLLWTRREGIGRPVRATVSDGKMSTIRPAVEIVFLFGTTVGINPAMSARRKTATDGAPRN
jgi:hypothetical protein